MTGRAVAKKSAKIDARYRVLAENERKIRRAGNKISEIRAICQSECRSVQPRCAMSFELAKNSRFIYFLLSFPLPQSIFGFPRALRRSSVWFRGRAEPISKPSREKLFPTGRK